MSIPVEVIHNFVKALTKTKKKGTNAADEAFKAVGAVNYSTLVAQFKADQLSSSSQVFLEQYCGININNSDTGAITGYDASGNNVKTAESIISETAKAINPTEEENKSFTKNGLKVNITYDEKSDSDAGKNFGNSGEVYLAKQKLVIRAIYNWWLPESLDLINESLGINFIDGRASINAINIVFEDSKSDQAIELNFSYKKGLASKATLKINTNLLYNMTTNDKKGTLPENSSILSKDFYDDSNSAKFTNYLDRLFLQSMAEITLKANVPYVTKLPAEIRMGLAEVVGGYDDSTINYEIFSTPGYSLYDNKQYIGYSYMRYLAKNYSDNFPDGLSYNSKKTVLTVSTKFKWSTINLADFAETVKIVKASSLQRDINIIGNALDNSIISGSGNDYLYGAYGNDTLNGGAGNDTLYGVNGEDNLIGGSGNDVLNGGSGYDTLNGGSGDDKLYGENNNDSLIGGSGNDSLYGGSDNDTLNGGKGNDILNGGNGNDLFVYTAGNDVITDYAEGDKVSIGTAISEITTRNFDVIFTTDNGTLTVQNGIDRVLSLINDNGKEYTTVVSGLTTLILTDADPDFVTLGSAIKIADASARTRAVNITDNDLDNTIIGGKGNDTLYSSGKGNDSLFGNAGNDVLYGQRGNNTLDGGKGNDTLYGGGGNDVLIGNAGKDILYGGNSSDYLSGGTGNDILYGEKGNNTLWGGAGNDTLFSGNDRGDIFLYASGEGKDVISGFTNNDMLLITGTFSASYNKSKKELAFKVESTEKAITIKDFSATSFNVNGFNYQINGTKFVKK